MKNHNERPGKGVLFTNDKRKTDTQPHLKGRDPFNVSIGFQ
jgi:hypothetical protein